MLIEQFICREDNFGVLIHDERSGYTAAIDAPESKAICSALKRRNWTLQTIFVTHHHHDHIEALAELKQIYKAVVIGPEAEKEKIGHLDQALQPDESLFFGTHTLLALSTPGHTLGSLSYYFPQENLLFSGDTLFSLGCGRLFEGTPAQMLNSFKKLRQLPDETLLYCGHEYTKTNALFALTLDSHNQKLHQRVEDVFLLRAKNAMTLPVTLGQEKATNPFLRWDDRTLRKNLAMEKETDEEVFAEIRKRKDNF
ncbi:hydroxyacylglutathione hydrolase [Bartonella quintana]|uniref:Hydroxyacylglutathione hydrolase n=3 Tax=Bartonella quintana TaxID=803 RepID=GLO2_BARQU|nr:hydroxyacylglutathione hydrolase [Bartonella quintana]Q6FYC3.1 RecName: Full=Hydroxyacylglutathione hydrolase; AltName: Full=Glyoxalase II; Short=Glx II [Bartonella quintana str. Toulouse]ETS13691.1 hydroxyacylglutathione hydrolase [Bartonella quintana BQ2-D70]ETS14871.1 hydroxyacylglutathione hydrolase [Bartonella quintana JK 73rel]ETS16711.1 hydroxyacylglutathione hydrolase [Bartonella quintana JK 73]ETS16958.1 hydroxyacylglutathione hydrolase [Bartonella quintana JK 12]ETS19252.1 hydrox